MSEKLRLSADTVAKAADMLAADSQQAEDKHCNGMDSGRVMQRAFALCPTDHPHQWRMKWMADYFTANSQQVAVPQIPESLLRKPVKHVSELGPCHCPPGTCSAPVIMGQRAMCLRNIGSKS